jgi:hypothetical protein
MNVELGELSVGILTRIKAKVLVHTISSSVKSATSDMVINQQ